MGLWLFVSPFVLPMVKKEIQVMRFKNDLRSTDMKHENKIISHIRLLLNVVYSTKSYFAVFVFFMISFILFIVTFSVLFSKVNGIVFQFLFSLLMGLLPYILLNVKLKSIQVEGSYEAESLLTKLSNQYKINNRNMTIAIDKTIQELKDAPYSKKALFRLSIGIKEYRKPDDLKNLIFEFTYGIGTEWANILGTCLFFSINDGLDVSESLDDIIRDLKVIKNAIEKAKRDNNEAFVLIKYIVPVLYVLFVFIAMKTFDFSIQKFFEYQFKTSLGLKTGTLVFGTMIFNYILYLLFKKPKYDF